jgi:hypothetical protein
MRRLLLTTLLSLPLIISVAYATNSKLSGLSSAAAISGTDLFYDVQSAGAGGVKETAAQLLTLMQTDLGQVPIPSYTSSNWYNIYGYPPSQGSVGGSQAVAAATVYCAPAWVPTAMTIKTLGADVVTAVAASNAQFAVYSFSAGVLTLVDSTASVATTGTGSVSKAVANTTDVLSAGKLYFLCANDDSAVTFTGVAAGLAGSVIGSSTGLDVTSATASSGIQGVKWSASLGTWAATENLSATTNVTNASGVILPFVAVQVN